MIKINDLNHHDLNRPTLSLSDSDKILSLKDSYVRSLKPNFNIGGLIGVECRLK